MPLKAIETAKKLIVTRLKKRAVNPLSDSELNQSLTEKMLPVALSWRRENYKQMKSLVIK